MEEPGPPATDPPRAVTTFIVRATRADDGRLTGTIERVRTGERQRFDGNEAIGALIDQMAADDREGAGAPKDGPSPESSP